MYSLGGCSREALVSGRYECDAETSTAPSSNDVNLINESTCPQYIQTVTSAYSSRWVASDTFVLFQHPAPSHIVMDSQLANEKFSL